nr:uncharacterized protein MAL8P1.12-like [Hydra vulgaris]
MIQYSELCLKPAEAVLKSLEKHNWYLNERFVIMCLADKCLPVDQLHKLALKLAQTAKPTKWLKISSSNWETCSGYIRFKNYITGLLVVNDSAELAFKLDQDFIEIFRNEEDNQATLLRLNSDIEHSHGAWYSEAVVLTASVSVYEHKPRTIGKQLNQNNCPSESINEYYKKKVLRNLLQIYLKKKQSNANLDKTKTLLKKQEKNFASLTAGNFKMFTERLDKYEKENINNLIKIIKFENDLEQTNKKVVSVENDLLEIKKFNQTNNDIASEKFELVKSKTKEISSKLKDNSEILKVKIKLREVEDRSRRNNLRVDGLKENKNESWSDSEAKVLKLFEETLGLKGIKIERAHRTGSRDNKKVRSIVLKLLNYKDKENILKNCRKLKEENIYVNEGYCVETMLIRKELRAGMKKGREAGMFAYISYDKLVVREWSRKATDNNSDNHTETLLESEYYSILESTQYLFHQMRDICVGGGISIHNSIDFIQRKDLNVNNTYCEALCVEIINKLAKNLIINAIYRTPAGSLKTFKTYLRTFLNTKNILQKHVYAVGDINIDLLNHALNSEAKTFIDILLEYNLIPTINKATRITKNSSTLLDNVITNNFHNSRFKNGIINTDLTDHFPIFLITESVTLNNATHKSTVFMRQINENSICQFKNLLNNYVDWNLVLQSHDVNNAYDLFLNQFSKIYLNPFVFAIKCFDNNWALALSWGQIGIDKINKYKGFRHRY